MSLVAQCEDLATYDAAVARFLEEFDLSGQLGPVPVLVEGRPDLVDIASGLGLVYTGTVLPTRVFRVGEVSEGAARSTGFMSLLHFAGSDMREKGASREILLSAVGVYQEVDYGFADASGDGGRNILVGRDLASLSWMLAKQFLAPRKDLSSIAVNGVSEFESSSVDVFLTQSWLSKKPLADVLLSGAWNRVLLMGNGHDHITHLGQTALCGAGSSGIRGGIRTSADGYSPPCGIGGECVKAGAPLLPVRDIEAAYLTLASCLSGSDRTAATYDQAYSLHLAAADSLASSVTVLDTVCDAGLPELSAWLKNDGREASAMNAQMVTVNGYFPFVTNGFR